MATDVTRRVIGSTGENGQAPLGSEVPSDVLLGRTVSAVDETKFADYLAGATVAVTGAAGAVGSELCMRLARLGAAKLVLVDQAEAALIDLLTMLEHEGFAQAVPVLADVRSRPRAVAVFEQHRPEIVFHAAAYKQVPLLEANPVEAVATNVFGTHSVVDAARHTAVNCFVLFSTDKAVEPTSILGQTKAIAEWIVAAAGRDVSQARYGAVRLGNVADSAGSMLPLFRRRVATGEPVPVTHPSATRYMMTVGEAAGLAVVAEALADSTWGRPCECSMSCGGSPRLPRATSRSSSSACVPANGCTTGSPASTTRSKRHPVRPSSAHACTSSIAVGSTAGSPRSQNRSTARLRTACGRRSLRCTGNENVRPRLRARRWSDEGRRPNCSAAECAGPRNRTWTIRPQFRLRGLAPTRVPPPRTRGLARRKRRVCAPRRHRPRRLGRGGRPRHLLRHGRDGRAAPIGTPGRRRARP